MSWLRYVNGNQAITSSNLLDQLTWGDLPPQLVPCSVYTKWQVAQCANLYLRGQVTGTMYMYMLLQCRSDWTCATSQEQKISVHATRRFLLKLVPHMEGLALATCRKISQRDKLPLLCQPLLINILSYLRWLWTKLVYLGDLPLLITWRQKRQKEDKRHIMGHCWKGPMSVWLMGLQEGLGQAYLVAIITQIWYCTCMSNLENYLVNIILPRK